jgi:uncharacterized protein
MKTIKQKFLHLSITRIVLGLILSFAVFVIAQQLVRKTLDLTTINNDFRNLIKGSVASFFVILAYILFYTKSEKRKIEEYSTKGLLRNITVGVLIGSTIQCLTIVVICLAGNFEILSINSYSAMITPFAIALSVAIFEETILRGIIFRIVEEKLGSHISLLISAVIFGAVHMINPNSSLISTLCATLVGFTFGALYIYSRNLWLPIAVHFSWNFVQSGIFGAVTSGNEKTNSLLSTNISGSELITGGSFGPEGTIQATLLWLIASILLQVIITKQNKLIKPSWRKATTVLFI